MAWIRTVEPNDADRDLAGCYSAMLRSDGVIWNVFKVQSLKPGLLRRHLALYHEVFSEPGVLSAAERELIAVAVASANECHY